MLRRCLLAVAVAPFLLAQTAPADRPPLEELSRKLDQLYWADSSRGKVKMFVETPHYERELSMTMLTQGRELALVRITEPRKEAGIATLKRKNEMWNYLPKIGKTIRVPPSMMAGSWMGSDFTNDDLVREASWENDYDAKYLDEAPEGQVCVEFQAKKDAAVPWERMAACFDPTTLLPVTLDFFDEKGRNARTVTYSDIKDLGGMKLPARLTLVPHRKEGHRTVIVYEELEFSVKHPKNTFSLATLKRGR